MSLNGCKIYKLGTNSIERYYALSEIEYKSILLFTDHEDKLLNKERGGSEGVEGGGDDHQLHRGLVVYVLLASDFVEDEERERVRGIIKEGVERVKGTMVEGGGKEEVGGVYVYCDYVATITTPTPTSTRTKCSSFASSLLQSLTSASPLPCAGVSVGLCRDDRVAPSLGEVSRIVEKWEGCFVVFGQNEDFVGRQGETTETDAVGGVVQEIVYKGMEGGEWGDRYGVIVRREGIEMKDFFIWAAGAAVGAGVWWWLKGGGIISVN